MYKLLLATNDPAVVEAFSAVKWEELGFKQPRVVSTAEEALSSLRVNHADAVAIGLPKEQDDLLVEQLLEKNDPAVNALLDQCDLETVVQHTYTPGCMGRRNRYMVDRSSLLLAVYDGIPRGGTMNTLAYAMRQGVQTVILPVEEEVR